jgi:hypothetical protein
VAVDEHVAVVSGCDDRDGEYSTLTSASAASARAAAGHSEHSCSEL